MLKVKCPYYLSQSNGLQLYINCSPNGHISKSMRTGFNTAEKRKDKLSLHCDHSFEFCETYKTLKGSTNL